MVLVITGSSDTSESEASHGPARGPRFVSFNALIGQVLSSLQLLIAPSLYVKQVEASATLRYTFSKVSVACLLDVWPRGIAL